jgi:hypothetical protein
MLPMRSSERDWWGAMRRCKAMSVASVIALATAACATSTSDLRSASRSYATRFGYPGCDVSVPLSQEQAIKQAKRDGAPDPESRRDWRAMIEQIRPGDSLRLIDCLRASKAGRMGDPYFYAVFRDGKIVAKFNSVIID